MYEECILYLLLGCIWDVLGDGLDGMMLGKRLQRTGRFSSQAPWTETRGPGRRGECGLCVRVVGHGYETP